MIPSYLQLTNEDNMNLMSRYPDNHFDLAIVDPEYGIGASKVSVKPNRVKQSNGSFLSVKQSRYDQKDWDFKKSNKNYFENLYRISKNQIIWGANYYNLPGGRIVWDKLVAEGADQYSCEIAYQSFSNRTDVMYYMWAGMMQGVYCGRNRVKAMKQQGNKKLNEKRIHPTQKPVALYRWLLKNYAKEGDKILDTHLGSASIAIAIDQMNKVEKMNLTLTACELDEDYFRDSIKRVREQTMQMSLFQ